MSQIPDAECKKADSEETVGGTSASNPDKQRKLKELLSKAESLFDGTLGEWDCKPHHIQLKEEAKPCHAKPFPVPKAHERTLQNEIEQLVNTGVLEQVDHLEWGAPSFIIGKKMVQCILLTTFGSQMNASSDARAQFHKSMTHCRNLKGFNGQLRWI